MNSTIDGATRPLPLADRVMAMVDRFGSPEERQLVRGHAEVIRAFLGHPNVQLGSRRTELDIGLENALTLKFNLVATGRGSPWAMIDQFAEWAPALRDVSELVLRHKVRCHAGIKLTKDGVEYELYPYETPEGLWAGRCGLADPADTRLPADPYCYGFSSDGSVSAYARVEQVPVGELESAAGFRIAASGLMTRALFHSRQDAQGGWTTGKAGIEFLPFPSHLLNTVLQQFHLNFSYLLHRGGSRPYGVIGVRGSRQVLYTTLVPRPPAGTGAEPDAGR